MARQLDQIVVIDVEATCWEGAPPDGQELEIIEVGVCPLVVATSQRLERHSILVRPARSTVSAYCTALIGAPKAHPTHPTHPTRRTRGTPGTARRPRSRRGQRVSR